MLHLSNQSLMLSASLIALGVRHLSLLGSEKNNPAPKNNGQIYV